MRDISEWVHFRGLLVIDSFTVLIHHSRMSLHIQQTTNEFVSNRPLSNRPLISTHSRMSSYPTRMSSYPTRMSWYATDLYPTDLSYQLIHHSLMCLIHTSVPHIHRYVPHTRMSLSECWMRWSFTRMSLTARPYESCKIFKGQPRRNAFSKLVHRQYKSFPPDRFCQVGMNKTTLLSNKPSSA